MYQKMKIKNTYNTSAGKDMEQPNLAYIASDNVKYYSHSHKQLTIVYKAMHLLTI